MRILFSVSNFGFLRNFEPALRELAARGHDLHLLADRRDSVGGLRTVENLQRAYPERVTHAYAPSRKDAFWQPLAVYLRLCLDYWRYLDPRYDQSPSLRRRAAGQAPPFASRLPRWPVVGSRAVMPLWRALFHWMERAMPVPPAVEAVLREQRPDLLLMTPLLYFGSSQVEYVRAARAMGIPVILGVGSWDHLTTKGLIHEAPDRVVVWNEFQKREAWELHGIAPELVTVTGAQAYDHWFVQRPSTTREAFCAKVGLPADRPLLLYLCSSPFITPHEVPFVERWIAGVRSHRDPALAHAAILIRPHPQNAAQWASFRPDAHDAVAVWPRAGANPVDTDARAEYYDSMWHSVAMVGVNTSALIESGIVGRPVYTVLTEEFAGQQEGTLHFQHLKNANGGLLTVGATLDEHLDQLAGAVRGEFDQAKSRAFVEAFIRPYGLEAPAAPRFVEAVEAERQRGTARPGRPSSGAIRRLLLRPLAAAAHAAAARRKRDRRAAEAPAAAAMPPRRLLFVLGSPEYLRYFDATMTELADRGHRVLVAVNALGERKEARLELMDDPRIEVVGVLPGRADLWSSFVEAVRGTLDFVRYLHPAFVGAPALRARMRRKVLPWFLQPLDRVQALTPATLARVIRSLQQLEAVAPVSGEVRSYLRAADPDVVVVSPLIDAASEQVDVVRAARAEGIPSVAAIASWDNLTNKGHMRVLPDLVTVWNHEQRREAVELHGVPAQRVVVTGAQVFDRWFDRHPALDRTAFCAMVGLPDDRPFVLFTGSSVFIARSELEVPFVRQWLRALRASADPRVRDVAVLVRPHPFNADAWITADLSDLGPVAVWPRRRYTPAEETARTSFFDSLFHSAAVVGINTSAMIEAAILRKPVLSVVTPEFAGTQEGTLHFHYLLPENGGFLLTASALDDHVAQLSTALQRPEQAAADADRFVARFLRPYGREVAGTARLAEALESAMPAAADDHAATVSPRLGAVLRPFMVPVALLLAVRIRFGTVRGIGGLRKLARRLTYETRFQANRTTRLLHKRLLVYPSRRVSRVAYYTRRRTGAFAERGLKRSRRVLSPQGARDAVRAARRGGRVGVRAGRRLLRGAVRLVRWPAVRGLRLARQVRYHAAVRLRGGAVTQPGSNDVQQ